MNSVQKALFRSKVEMAIRTQLKNIMLNSLILYYLIWITLYCVLWITLIDNSLIPYYLRLITLHIAYFGLF